MKKLALTAVIVLGGTGVSGCAGAVEENLARIRLPPGFEISVYARVPGARSMAPAPRLGVIFVGTRGSRLYAVEDRDGDGTGETVTTIARGLRVPNGVAFHDGYLYVAEQHRVFRYKPRKGSLAPRGVETIFGRLPDKGHHGWRYAAMGPDGKLYVTVGAPCNICEVSGLEGTVIRMDVDGGNMEVFARGVRNSVGIDFHPTTGQAFFTDNGGDHMGDDSPPDELNHAPRAGLHFGYPHFAGGRAVSPGYGGDPPPGARFPAVDFGAHVAALGIHFYRGRKLPREYRNDAFVAQHGSWNRSVPDGYRVMRIRFDKAGEAVSKEVFASGWLRGGSAWGRPVDVKELTDGSLLVSDDRADVIYRITYKGQ